MPTPRYIGSLLLVALMLTATIGISIYKHTCMLTGHKGVSMFMVAQADEEPANSCCAISNGACKKSAEEKEKDGCCEESASFYQLDIPQKNEEHYSYNAPLLPVIGLVSLPDYELSFVEESALLPLFNSLPPPDIQSRLSQLQVYRL